MKSMLSGVALAATLSLTITAQQPPSGYHSVACIKVKPGKVAEYQKWTSDSVHKLQQANADSGRISAWYLVSSVMPQGNAAMCDYYSVSFYPGSPPAPMGRGELEVALKKASTGMSAQAYIEKRTSLTDLVSLELWQTHIAVGTVKKGDYLYLNRMKVPKLEEWIETEKKIWQPMAEQWVKDGGMHGWSLNVAVIPGGSELKYQATTVDVFPSWDAAMKYGNDIAATFKKVHAGMDMEHTFEYLKMRDLAVQDLLTVEDVVTPAK